MASPRKTRWTSWQRFAEKLVFDDGPRLIRQLRDVPAVQQGIQRGIEQGIKLGLEMLSASGSEPMAPAGRPVTSSSAPSAHRARRIVYAPDLAGRADPGEIVWTWVADGDDASRGQDRPVLVVGRDRHTLLGLLLSSPQHHAEDSHWVEIGTGSWDDTGRPSWVQLDRVLDVPEESIRREGAILQRATFEVVAARLRTEYSWR